MIRVLVVDDHPVLRDGLSAMIESHDQMILLAEAATGVDGVRLFHEHRPDVTIMDLRLPDIDGIEAIRQIRQDSPEARIIVLTSYLGDMHAGRALKAGASAFLLKATLRHDLLDTIVAVYQGKKRISLDVASDMAEYAGGAVLTSGEVQVLQQVASGTSNKDTSLRLGISERAVREHIQNLLFKLDATNETHAVAIALRRGFFEI